MGLVGRDVIAENSAAFDLLAVEPAHRTAQEAHRGRPLLVSQYLDVGQAGSKSYGYWLVGSNHYFTLILPSNIQMQKAGAGGGLPIVKPSARF